MEAKARNGQIWSQNIEIRAINAEKNHITVGSSLQKNTFMKCHRNVFGIATTVQ